MADEIQKPINQEPNPESIKDRTLKEDEVFGKDPDAQKKEVEDQGKKAVEKAIVRFSSKEAFPDEDDKDISELSLAELNKMKKEELRYLILKGTSESGIYRVDFEGNKKAEAKIGLQNIFDAENPLLIVQKNSDEDAFYAERGKDGFYYEPGTSRKVNIFTGYQVRVLGNGDDLADFKKEADNDRMANLKKAKRNEGIAHRGQDEGFSKTQKEFLKDLEKEGGPEAVAAYKEQFRKERAEEIAQVKAESAKAIAENPEEKKSDKLLAFLNNINDEGLSASQISTIVKGMISLRPDFDIDKQADRAVMTNVSEYCFKNPSIISQENVQTLAVYEGLDANTKKEIAASLKKQNIDLNLSNPLHIKGLTAIFRENDANALKKEEGLRIQNRLVTYLDKYNSAKLNSAQRLRLAKGLISYKPDFNADAPLDGNLLKQVAEYFKKNPQLSERQLVTVARYTNMPNSDKENMALAFKEKGYDLAGGNSPKIMAMLEKALEEKPKGLNKEAWAQLIDKVANPTDTNPTMLASTNKRKAKPKRFGDGREGLLAINRQ